MSERSVARAPRDQQLHSLIEEVLASLRLVYRSGASEARSQAVQLLGELKQQASPSHQTDQILDLQLQRLRSLSTDDSERKADVKSIADELNSLRPLIGVAPPDTKYGKLNSALRQTRQTKQRSTAAAAKRPLALEDLVETVPKVGPKGGQLLGNMQIQTVGDLLRHVPRDHIDYGQPNAIGDLLRPSGPVIYRGVLRGIRDVYGRGKPRVEATLRDATGSIGVTWFSTFVSKQLHDGDEVVIRGAVRSDRHGYQLSPIEWERTDNPEIAEGRLIPIYPLTKGITQKRLRTWTHTALDLARPSIVDWLSEIRTLLDRDRTAAEMLPLDQAFQQLHFPDSVETREAARNRMAFDLYLLLQLGLIQRKAEAKTQPGPAMTIDPALNQIFRSALPFQMTSAQNRSLGEILADMKHPSPMTRLLQGDVGSGKTVVAAMAAYVAHNNHYQSALLAPTEILAEQHYRSLSNLFDLLPIDIRPKIDLLTGSTRATVRRKTAEDLVNGTTSLLVGTHAIIEAPVTFHRLGLVIIDEQHRFGVHQRGLLMQKARGYTPHVLSMTATPIPKTLNHVVHGDLDVSLIDQLPPGRIEIETHLFDNTSRARAERLIRDEIASGHQVFVICPLVDDPAPEDYEADSFRMRSRLDAKAAVSEAERLQSEVFPDLSIGVVHGQMTAKKKDEAMTAFRDRHHQILVATSVIEVGIDILNATVIMIEGADRFGLSQLHQLRGRVGRGSARSYCLLMSDSSSAVALERLQALVSTTDGFVLAQKDLELRGPGDFIGTRQSGMPEMEWIGKGFDSRLLDRAHSIAEQVLARSGGNLDAKYPQLARQLTRFWEATESLDTTKA
ncbi:MAG: ATP-dependent DNA helicase RecG [Thermomicrobiales bacterium]